MNSLFRGTIDEQAGFAYPVLASDDADALLMQLEQLRRNCATRVDAAKIDGDEAISDAVFALMREERLFGLVAPSLYGGGDMSLMAFARVMQELGRLDPSVAFTISAHALAMDAIVAHGTDEQKSLFLPRLASGEAIAAFALNEEGGGADPAAIRSHAQLTSTGDYVISGSKVWITNGGIADLFIVFARTSVDIEGVKPKITAFIVEKGEGITQGPELGKLGLRGTSTTRVDFDRVRVPVANVIGAIGGGFKLATELTHRGRLVNSSVALGMCKAFIALAVERAGARTAQGRAIGEFGMIKDKIAQMMADTFAFESMLMLTIARVDAGGDCAIESAICKVVGSETVLRVAAELAQIAGGSGYMRGYSYERHLRDSRALMVLDGTNELTRAFIAMNGMRSAEPAPHRSLADALRDPIKEIEAIGERAVRRAKSALGQGSAHVDGRLESAMASLTGLTKEFGHGVEKVRSRHGRAMGEMQYTQRRVADIAIDLLAILSMISRTNAAIERRGAEGVRRELDLTRAAVLAAERRIRANLEAFDKNDDELRKAIASKAYTDGGYPLDLFF